MDSVIRDAKFRAMKAPVPAESLRILETFVARDEATLVEPVAELGLPTAIAR